MRSEHAHLWEASTAREIYGLLDAETFEQVLQSVDNCINTMWVFDLRADEYGWPTRPKASLLAGGV